MYARLECWFPGQLVDRWLTCSLRQDLSCEELGWFGVTIVAGVWSIAEIYVHFLTFCSGLAYLFVCLLVWCSSSFRRWSGGRSGRLWSEAAFLSFLCWRVTRWGRGGGGWWRSRRLLSQRGEEEKAYIWPSEVAGEEFRAGEQVGAGEENAAGQGIRSAASSSRSLVPKPKGTLENQTTGARLRGVVFGLQQNEGRIWDRRPGERKAENRGEYSSTSFHPSFLPCLWSHCITPAAICRH